MGFLWHHKKLNFFSRGGESNRVFLFDTKPSFEKSQAALCARRKAKPGRGKAAAKAAAPAPPPPPPPPPEPVVEVKLAPKVVPKDSSLTHSSSHGASVGAADLLGGGRSGPKAATASARVCARAHTTPPAGLIACTKLGLTPSNRKGQTAPAKKRETLRQLVQV